MKILSSSTLFQTCMNFFLLLKTVDSHSIFIYFFSMGYFSQWGTSTGWLPTFFLYVQRKKEIHTGLKQLEGE